MPAEIIDKLYEIAQKGGYAGDQPARWEGGIAAITSAITHDTPVLRDTVVDALDDLKTVAFDGGGGGGGDLGALQEAPLVWDTVPTVGATCKAGTAPISYVSAGDSKAVSAMEDIGFGEMYPAYIPLVAAGATVAVLLEDSEGTYSKAYLVTVNMNNGEITAAAEWSGTVTSQTSTITGYHDLLFTMPTLEAGTYLMLYAPMSGGGEDD